MKIEDIIALAKAGFSIEQIHKMSQLNMTMEPAPQPTPAPQPEPAKDYQKIFEELTGIKQAIQNGNIGGDSFTKPARTTDDILADLINPPRKGTK